MFKKLAGVTAFEKSKFFQEGRYVVKIRKVKFNESGFKGSSFVIETEILGTQSDNEDAPQRGEIAAQVWRVGDGEKREMAFATWKLFLTGAFEIESELSDEEWEELSMNVLEEGVLEGKVMMLQAWMVKTKAGGDFTQHKWLRPATDEDLAEFGIKQ
jgi:hypothetical protein